MIEEGGSSRFEMLKCILSYEKSGIPKIAIGLYESKDSDFGSGIDLLNELFWSNRYICKMSSYLLLFQFIYKKIEAYEDHEIGVVGSC